MKMPYRRNVGITVFNRAGLVFAGRCFSSGPEVVYPGFEWQMPQGGLEDGESLESAARRELLEETSIEDVSVLAISDDWWAYDFPPYAGPQHKLTAFRGQVQRWIAFRFDGDERTINVLSPAGQEQPEFLAWDWFPIAELPRLVVPYKRAVYERVCEVFAQFAASSRYPVRARKNSSNMGSREIR